MKDYLLTLQHNLPLGGGVFELKLFSNEAFPAIVPGQFLNIEVPDESLILRRPFCINKWGTNHVVIVVEKKGKGTEALARLKDGAQLRAILPIGSGFYLKDEWKRVAIVGGGVGCAPLYGIMPTYPDRQYYSYIGFRDKNSVMFEEDFAAHSRLKVCTYDGSYGTKGYQAALLEADLDTIKPDVIITCGGKSLIKSIKALSEKYGIPALMSAEQRMACGVGACLGCTCKINDEGTIKNKRVCLDGPVFDLKDVVL